MKNEKSFKRLHKIEVGKLSNQYEKVQHEQRIFIYSYAFNNVFMTNVNQNEHLKRSIPCIAIAREK